MNEKEKTFVALTGASPEVAREAISAAKGDLDVAVNAFFGEQGGELSYNNVFKGGGGGVCACVWGGRTRARDTRPVYLSSSKLQGQYPKRF